LSERRQRCDNGEEQQEQRLSKIPSEVQFPHADMPTPPVKRRVLNMLMTNGLVQAWTQKQTLDDLQSMAQQVA
jgi:hypothetical protein